MMDFNIRYWHDAYEKAPTMMKDAIDDAFTSANQVLSERLEVTMHNGDPSEIVIAAITFAMYRGIEEKIKANRAK
jgi:hypothetical protein